MEHLNVYKKSSRKDASNLRFANAKDAKLLFVILSLYFQDSCYFEYNISCKMRIYRIRTLRLRTLVRCAFARENSGIMFVKFKMLQSTRCQSPIWCNCWFPFLCIFSVKCNQWFLVKAFKNCKINPIYQFHKRGIYDSW